MPGWSYDAVARRWQLQGADNLPKMYIPDSQTRVSLIRSFVGTTPAIGIASLGGLGIATLTGVVDTVVGDKVFVTPRTLLTLGIAGVAVSTNNTVHVAYFNPVGAVGTQPATGFDVLVIKTE